MMLQDNTGSLPGPLPQQHSCSTLYEQNICFKKLPEPLVLLQAGKALVQPPVFKTTALDACMSMF